MDLVFATLTPVNVLAKLAFSDVFDALTAGRQDAEQDDDHGPLAVRHMWVGPQQEYHADVLRLRLAIERRQELQARYGDSSDDSLTEPNTDTEAEL